MKIANFKITAKVFVSGAILVGAALAFASAVLAQTDEFSVRVAVLKNAKDFSLSVRGTFVVYNDKDETILRKRSLRKSKVEPLDDGIKVGDQMFESRQLRIVPEGSATVYVGKHRYRGDIDIIKEGDAGFLVVNTIGLEEYVRGVLYHEVSHRWPLEAIKAQAVAVRTYAIYRIKSNESSRFDVTSDIYSQVYGGRNSERYRTNIAAKRTAYQVLTYRDKILPAYFHATCGGFAEDAGALWKHTLKPLEGKACPYCVESPHYLWKKNFRSKDVQDKLNARGFKVGLIKDIRVIKRNPSNRISELMITARDGVTLTISGKDFRNIVGPNAIKSNNYEVFMKGYYFDLRGKGWGHGVGLCQWGAKEMAHQRYDYVQILNFYYPGSTIINYRKEKL